MAWKLELFFVFVFVYGGASESPFACQPTTVRPGNGLPYYEIITNQKTYEEAESQCRLKGAELYTIRDENQRITTFLIRTSWLSAKRRYWTHDNLDLGLTYEVWAEDEPTSAPDRCVLADNNGTTIKLHSEPCSNKHDVLCMKQGLASCDGEHVYNYYCYFIPEANATSKTFTEATAICSDHFGHVIFILNQQQLDWISLRFNHTFWTGYKYNESSTDFYLYDGGRVSYTNWLLGQPATGDCVIVNEDGQWLTSECDNTNDFICILEVPYATQDASCTQFGEECVCYWLSASSISFDKSMEFCMSEGGTLAYPNREDKLQYIEDLYGTTWRWLGISNGHTVGVWRGSDWCVLSWTSWYPVYPSASGHCVYLYTTLGYSNYDCRSAYSAVCQSNPDPLFYPCYKRSGCLLTLDYWDVEDPKSAYNGPASLTIKKVKHFEICWYLCVSYIGFECLVVTYKKATEECMLSPDTSGEWVMSSLLQSRNRTRRVIDPESYCLEKLQESDFTGAQTLCANYKTGWAIPVIRDEVMLEKIKTISGTDTWISGVQSLPAIYKTLDDEYLPFSKFSVSEPSSESDDCLVVDATPLMFGYECTTYKSVVCMGSVESLCRTFPNITNGRHVQDPVSFDVSYTCEENYFMPEHNTTSLQLKCTCDWTEKLEQIENCTAIQCSEPKDTELTTVVQVFGLQVNQTVQYRSAFGYRVAETASIFFNLTCMRVANTTRAVWSDIPELEVLTCPEFQPPDNSTFITHEEGDFIEIICDEGFRILNKTNNTITTSCVTDDSGQVADWCWTPPCQEILCSEPIDVDMATYVLHGYKAGNDVIYTCNTNYKINGTSSNTTNVTCGYDNQFNGVWLNLPTCTPVTCDEVPNVKNATLETNVTTSAIGDMITYQCARGFSVHKDGIQVDNETSFNLTCEMDYEHFTGKWVGNLTCDVAECDLPPSEENSSLHVTDSQVNSVANYTCDKNFIINSTGTKWTLSTCVIGDNSRFPFWTKVEKCLPIICDDSYNTTASLLEETGVAIDDVRYYRCPSGSRVKHSDPPTTIFSILCQLDDDQLGGTWTKPPLCIPVTCTDPPLVENADVTVRGYNLGDTALYTCKTGYQPNSVYLGSTCVLDEDNQGLAVWDPVPQCIEWISYDQPLIRQCLPPAVIVGATVHYRHLFVDEWLSYLAVPGYIFDSGSKVRSSICQTGGQWSVNVPNLKQMTCPTIPNVPGATKSTDNKVYGTEVRFECIEPKAKLENGLSLTTTRCTFNGEWTFVPRKCDSQRCGPFPMIEHSSLIAYNNTVGGQAVLRCDISYRFEDGQRTKSFQCLPTLQWQEPKQCYLNTCPPLRLPTNGTISTELALEDTKVEVRCLIGFMFADRTRTKSVVCNSTFQWTEEITDCQDVTCPTPPEISNGVKTSNSTSYNSTVTYRCEEVHRLQYGYKELTIRCQEDGQWTYNWLSCDVDRCPPVPEVNNTSANTTLALNGTTVEYTCDSGFVFSGYQSNMLIYCNGSNWNITETACTRIQCAELNLTHATWTDNGRYFGDSVQFTCDEGFIYGQNITGTLRCQANGEWNSETTGCLPVDCGLPSDVAFATHSVVARYGYGTSITYQCLPGYWFQRGQTNKTVDCSRHGVWSEIPGDCTPITCRPVSLWDGVEANTSDNYVGSAVNATCPGDTKGFVVSLCMPSGEWQPDLETCTSEGLIAFEPEPEEAEGSDGIGMVVLTIMALAFVAMVASDIPIILRAIKGQRTRHHS